MSQNPDVFLLRGGMDLATPSLAVVPGRARAAVNYESLESGYRRNDGYERYDGRPSPSDAFFDYIRYSARVDDIDEGDEITGADSAATGEVLVVVPDDPLPGNDAPIASSTLVLASNTEILASSVPTADVVVNTGYIIIHSTDGEFESGEDLEISAGVVATAASSPLRNTSPTFALTAEYLSLVTEAMRALIEDVPGTGPVRGVWRYQDELYAFRNGTGINTLMFKATAVGWTQVDLGLRLNFSAGTAEFQEGETVTRSGITATIQRVVTSSGLWTDGSAVGYLTISGASGAFTAGVATSASGSATISGPAATNLLGLCTGDDAPFRFTNHDFGQGERMYASYGKGRAFEFDGTYFTLIRTPLTLAQDLPLHIAVFANHLFLTFEQGAMLFSAIGNPMDWSTTGGAGEIALGSTPRGLIESAATALFITCRTKRAYLIGRDAATFELKELSSEAGAWGNTEQNIGRPLHLDQRGLRSMEPDNTLAGFSMGTLSGDIATIFRSYERGTVRPMCSLRCMLKDQYRAYFSDGTGLAFYFGRDLAKPEATQFRMPVVMTCAMSDSSSDAADFAGTEFMFAGGADGFVYQLDRGKSFDGEEIEAWLRLPFNMLKMSQINKRFHSADIEIDAGESTTLGISAAFDYDDGGRSGGIEESLTAYGNGGYWDEAIYEEANYDSPVSGTMHHRIDGVGQSVALLLLSKSAVEDPHTLTAVRLNWSQRKYRR